MRHSLSSRSLAVFFREKSHKFMQTFVHLSLSRSPALHSPKPQPKNTNIYSLLVVISNRLENWVLIEMHTNTINGRACAGAWGNTVLWPLALYFTAAKPVNARSKTEIKWKNWRSSFDCIPSSPGWWRQAQGGGSFVINILYLPSKHFPVAFGQFATTSIRLFILKQKRIV